MRSKLLSIFLALSVVLTLEAYLHRSDIKYFLKYRLFAPNCEKFELNSKEYWDCRFKTNDWQSHHGDEQSAHFYSLLINCIPDEIQKELVEAKDTVVDFGCAQGEGTELFAYNFPNTNVTGVDISVEGIEIAKRKNRKANFLAVDLTKSNRTWDILISSNTLEHFVNPWEILEQLSSKAKKYMIILVPFDQPGIPYHEHFYSFNYDNIPDQIKNFKLIYTTIAHPDPRFWGEKQILLVYKNTQ